MSHHTSEDRRVQFAKWATSELIETRFRLYIMLADRLINRIPDSYMPTLTGLIQ